MPRRHRQQMEEAASHGGSGPGGRDELLRTARSGAIIVGANAREAE